MSGKKLRLLLGAALMTCIALFATTAGATRLFRSNFSPYLVTANSQHRWHAIAADLDEDGKDDLLTSVWQSGLPRSLEVRMSGPDQEMSPNYTSYALGFGDEFGLVTAADLNGDGHLDVLVSDVDSIHILPGFGNGLLGTAQRVSVPGCGSGGIAVSDLNGDGKADVAVARQFVDKVSVLWGDDGLALTPGPEFTTSNMPYFVSIADLNGDGWPDVVVGANTTSTLLLADGSGGFTASSVAANNAIVAGDLNGDNDADLVATGGALLGQGNGTFQPPIPHGIPRPWLTTDLNEDGHPDLMGLSGSPLNLVLSQLGRGDGTFEPTQQWMAHSDAWTLAAGDLDGDGHVDVVKSTYTGVASFVHHGLGNGGFENAPYFAAGVSPATVAVGHLNGDAIPDIVMGSYASRFISVLRSTGPAAYDTPLVYPVPVGQRYLSVADLNGDELDDVVTATDSSASVSIWLAQPDGSLGERSTLVLPGAVRGFVLADLDLDGHRDVVYHYSDLPPLINFGAGFALGNGDGTFQALNALGYSLIDPLAVADMNGDGLPDLIGHSSTHSPRLAFASAPGLYPSFTDLTVGDGPFISGLAVGRWDDDSIPDLLLNAGGYKVFRGLGGGAFAAAHVMSEVAPTVSYRAWTDMNGDGLSDIVGAGSSSAIVYLGQPSGTFAPAVGAGVGRGAFALAVGDVDGNARPDMVMTTAFVAGGLELKRATILLNQLSIPNVSVEPRPGLNPRLAVRVSPNPATGEFRLSLNGGEASPARIELLDLAGRVLKNEQLPAGDSELVIGGGRTLAPGLYFARVRRGGAVVTSRICVVR